MRNRTPLRLAVGLVLALALTGCGSESSDPDGSSAEGGTAADVAFAQLMIPHHQAGVMMADAVIQKSSEPQVVKLANAIRTAQLAEIDQMRQMLTERGAGERT